MPNVTRVHDYTIEFPLSLLAFALSKPTELPSTHVHDVARAMLDASDKLVRARANLRKERMQAMLKQAGEGNPFDLSAPIPGSPLDPGMPAEALTMVTGWRIDYSRGEVLVSAVVPEGKDPNDLRREICEAVDAVASDRAQGDNDAARLRAENEALRQQVQSQASEVQDARWQGMYTNRRV